MSIHNVLNYTNKIAKIYIKCVIQMIDTYSSAQKLFNRKAIVKLCKKCFLHIKTLFVCCKSIDKPKMMKLCNSAMYRLKIDFFLNIITSIVFRISYLPTYIIMNDKRVKKNQIFYIIFLFLIWNKTKNYNHVLF